MAMTGVPEFTLPRSGDDWSTWFEEIRSPLSDAMRESGAVMLRGLPIENEVEFARLRDILFSEVASYVERATPRLDLGSDVFSSTEFPSSELIHLHNENSYAQSWPGTLIFGCLQAPDEGGATPTADVRKVLQRLPVDVQCEFLERGWMLVRNYRAEFGLPWHQAFGTRNPATVDQYCLQNQIESHWSETGLRTMQKRPALIRHPVTLDLVWFNHIAFWHPSSLEPDVREMLVEEFGEAGLPFNTLFGDGELIPDDIVEVIRAAYIAEQRVTPWQMGDVLVIDNILAAHGREPFRGARRIVISMGDPVRRSQCEVRDEAAFRL